MSATDRLHAEQVFHDQQAGDRRAYFDQHPESLAFDEEWFLNHESWVRPALEKLGNVRGLRVLDLGCGHGMASVVLARRGAEVTALDLSPGYLEEALVRARVNLGGERIRFVQGSAERLPFAAGSFDRVWGHAILHHLHVEQAARDVLRVLQPDGRAVVCEPWGENLVFQWARRFLPYPGKQRSRDERPLCRIDLDVLREYFSHVEVQPFQLVGAVRRLWSMSSSGGLRSPFVWLDRCDAELFRRWPGLSRFCRYLVLTLHP